MARLSGIQSASDMPVAQGGDRGEYTRLPGVIAQRRARVERETAAFCGRDDRATVVIGVSLEMQKEERLGVDVALRGN